MRRAGTQCKPHTVTNVVELRTAAHSLNFDAQHFTKGRGERSLTLFFFVCATFLSTPSTVCFFDMCNVGYMVHDVGLQKDS